MSRKQRVNEPLCSHHQHHGLVDIAFKTVTVIPQPLEGRVRVTETVAQLLLFHLHHVLQTPQMILQTFKTTTNKLKMSTRLSTMN